MTTAHDLIAEPLLSWRDAQRRRGKTTLPGILSKLASGELADFPRVRAHQFHPWGMFLTQLAAVALHRGKKTDPRLSEDEWRALLLELTDEAHEPWCLVVDDLSKPAFFQPPVPHDGIEKWSLCEYPDDMDVLVTSKGHDVKTSLLSSDDFEAWTLALVTLQTMQGYPGRGYNRIARMKGGYGSRPRVGLAADRTLATRFVRDIRVLLESWESLVARGFSDDGCAVVWTVPWNGEVSLAMPELSPHFIEVCWRVRCEDSAHGMTCAYMTTKNRRCLPEVDNGDAGDPWVPIETGEGALTVGSGGFHYQLLTKFLFGGDFMPAAAQVPRPDDSDPVLLLASAMARGQGKTEGLHERALWLTAGVRKRLGQPDSRAAVGKRASENVQQARKMRSKVLFPALTQLALGEKTLEDDFDARVDSIFFHDLFASLEQEDNKAQLAWDRRLREIAWAELQRAIDRCCVPSARRYQAISAAERMFRVCLKKQFPTLVAALEPNALEGGAA